MTSKRPQVVMSDAELLLMAKGGQGRERDFAIDHLLPRLRKLELDLKSRPPRPSELELELLAWSLRKNNGGELPKPKGGRPDEEHKHLLLIRDIEQRKRALGGARKTSQAIKQAAAAYKFGKVGITAKRAKEIYYNRDPEWKRLVKAEAARWALRQIWSGHTPL